VNRKAAGIDIGSKFHVVAVPPGVADERVRTFSSFTGELRELSAWLEDCGVTTVAMESTGVYWIPVFEILEEAGFEVLLVNASHTKNVAGRKTDVNDAQWIQRLHEHGLLRGSFRPRDEIVALRAYLRHRECLTQYAASHVQHMQKALMQMNVQLHHAVSDITGKTGMLIIRPIVDGEHNPAHLANHRDRRCKSSVATIEAALTGNYRPEHVFSLKQSVELWDSYLLRMQECDDQIEAVLARLATVTDAPAEPIPAARTRYRSTNAPKFDMRTGLYALIGVDLSQIHGFGPFTALKLIAECGDDMKRWPSAKHFTSWLTLAPGNKISGGKVLKSRTRRSSNRSAALLRQAAVSVGRTHTALGAFYRRLAARLGKAKAVTATARKLAVLFYNALRFGRDYVDPGQDYYEERYRQRALLNLKRRAASLGYELMDTETGEVIEGGVS
jgi:transposase